jgi:hypothetical protein
MVKKLEDLQVIKRHHLQLPSALASTSHTFQVQKPTSGLYELGHGVKSVVWYWEFDTEKRYFHQFRTVDFTDFTKTMKIYESKFRMWEMGWRLGRCNRFQPHGTQL